LITANLIWQNSSNLLWVVGVFAVALAWLIRGFLTTPLRGWPRAIAFTAKTLAWALIALCALDPVWTRTQPQRGSNDVAFLIDTSASMRLPAKDAESPRHELVVKALGDPETRPSWWLALEELFRLRLYGFGDQIRTMTDFGNASFDGQRSRLVGPVQTLSASSEQSHLAALVILTDGLASDASLWKPDHPTTIPIFPVLVGTPLETPDLSLLSAVVTQTPFEDSPVVIQAQVSARGYNGQSVTLALVDDEGAVTAQRPLSIEGDETETSIRLEVPGIAPGPQFRRLIIAPQDTLEAIAANKADINSRELTLANNVRRLCIDRGSGPYRILYISGRPNWEYKFLRRALHADDEVQMPALIRIAKREPKFEWRGRTGETSNPLFRGFGADRSEEAQRYDQPVLIRLETQDAEELSDGFPKLADELFGDYRAIIIDDLEAEFFTTEQMRLVEAFVSQRGGALLMLGGQESFRSGQYAHTPVGQILPVYLDEARRNNRIESGRFDLTREGWLEPWTRLSSDRAKDETRLATMPGFHATNALQAIKPGASLLATIHDAEGTAHPAMVAHRFGLGRVAAVPIADLWRWGMRDEQAREDLEQAWRQLIRWLVVDVDDRLSLEIGPPDPELPSATRLQIRVRDAAFQPRDDALVRLTVEEQGTTDEEGLPIKRTVFAEPSLEEAGLFTAEFIAANPGNYIAKVEVDSEDEQKESKTCGWTYDPAPEEMKSTSPDSDLLSRMAEETGGKLLSVDELDQLPSLLANLDVPVQETLVTPVWHAPWVFLAILLLLGTEWFLRRKYGWI
jgi:uncharacterized membrane protein